MASSDDLRKALIQKRTSLGVSQLALAQGLGVTQAYISAIESGKRTNTELVQKALDFLSKEMGKGKRNYARMSAVSTDKASNLQWAWLSFSRQKETGDTCDQAQIDTNQYSIMLADVVGSGLKSSWQAAQLRFGFHAISSTLSKFNNHPSAYSGPMGNALRATKLGSPPSVAFICLDCKAARLDFSVYGLPAPGILHWRKSDPANRETRFERLVNVTMSSDSLTKGDGEFNFNSIKLSEGDSFVIFTDGFYAWLRSAKKLSPNAIEKLFQEVLINFRGNAKAIIKALVDAGDSGVAPPGEDEATVLAITRIGDKVYAS